MYLSRDARQTHTLTCCFHLQLSAWSKPAITGTGPASQGQVRVPPFLFPPFIQHQIRARPVLEARESDMSWVQSCPPGAPKLEGRWTRNRELPLSDVIKCQELGGRNQGRFSGKDVIRICDLRSEALLAGGLGFSHQEKSCI